MHFLIVITLALFSGRLCYTLIKKLFEHRRESDIGVRHSCSAPPQLPNGWPLGIDWLRALWQSDSQQRLLAFLCSVADGYEPRNNLSQYFLFGPRAYHILDPRNVETILSSNFQGISSRLSAICSELILNLLSDYGFGVRDQVFAPLLGHGIVRVSSFRPDFLSARDVITP